MVQLRTNLGATIKLILNIDLRKGTSKQHYDLLLVKTFKMDIGAIVKLFLYNL